MKWIPVFIVKLLLIFVLSGCSTTFYTTDSSEIAMTKTSQELGIRNLPFFPGCEWNINMTADEFYDCSHLKKLEYIDQNLVYPELARKYNIKGTVYLRIHIDGTGDISEVILMKGIGYDCDEEAIRLMQEMPNWIPGSYINGAPLEMSTDIQVRFGFENQFHSIE